MRTSSVFSGLIPWLFIPFFTVFKLVTRPTANFAEAPFSELSPLLWELSGLIVAVAIMTAGKLLSTMASHPLWRSLGERAPREAWSTFGHRC